MPKYVCRNCGAPTDNDQSFALPNGAVIETHRCDVCEDRLRREVRWELAGSTYDETNVICPYCGHEYSDYDSYAFDEDGANDVECESCKKHFALEVRTSRRFTTRRSVCDMPEDFNGEELDYGDA